MVTFFWWEMGSRIPEEHRAAICSFSNSCKQTDVSSVLEESSWRFHTKIWKIHCPIKESKTWSFNHTAQCPRQIPHWNQVCSRRVSELPDISWKLTKNCFREATRSGIQRYIIFPEYICVCIYCSSVSYWYIGFWGEVCFWHCKGDGCNWKFIDVSCSFTHWGTYYMWCMCSLSIVRLLHVNT